MTRLHRILPALTLLAALTACGTTTNDTNSSPDSAPRPAVDVTQFNDDETTAIVDLTWDATSDSDKDDLCSGIAVFGTDFAAAQMRRGAGGDDSIDWDQAAQLVEAKCEQR